MKFGVIASERKAEVHEHEKFPIKQDEVLIRNRACNICTTDYQQWMGLRHGLTPMAFGHENSGVISKVGALVKNLKEGDHVVINPYRPCLECQNCRRGKNSLLCKSNPLDRVVKRKNRYGYYGHYGCAQYQAASAKHIFKMGEDIPFEQAGFSEPLATVIHGIRRLGMQVGDRVLVIGAGPMGFLNAQMAKYFGADVIVSELSEKKLDTVRKSGIDKIIDVKKDDYNRKIREYTDRQGLDAIIIAAGTSEAYNQAIEIGGKDCKMLIFAAGHPEPSWKLDPNTVHYNLWKIVGTYGCSNADFQMATEILNTEKIDVSPVVEEKVPLKSLQKAFEKASDASTFRISIVL